MVGCIDSSESGKLVKRSANKSSYGMKGGGRRVKIPEIRHALFEYEYFVDIRGTLK